MRTRASIKSHPIHPMLITFPFALWTGALIFDALALATDDTKLWITGFYMLVGGCVGAVLAAIPGVIDLFGSIPPDSTARRRGYFHGGLNVLALLLFAYLAFRRGSALDRPDNTVLLLELLGVVGIMVSGWLGATLVYRNQIGVDHRYANAGKWKERELESWDKPAMNPSELADGQMMLVKVDGKRIAIARCGDGVAAFSDHCTHRGGPLSDGAIVGCTVQCPWHGSQYDIHTGRVVSGPSDRQIETYETEIRNGEVYLLPTDYQRRQKTAAEVRTKEEGQEKRPAA
jgi:nitrite reductase/ring-hydroxylating ferredoxin subunit/uncharacterized membrane protein